MSERAGEAETAIMSTGDGNGPAVRPVAVRPRQRTARPFRASGTMDTAHTTVVAGVFATRDQAEAVLTDLDRIGLTAADAEVRSPTPGRYQVENRASQSVALFVAIGVIGGGLLGSELGLELLPVAVPAVADAGVGGEWLGRLIGGFWGAFYGGVAGLARVLRLGADQERWWAVPAGSAETVVLVRAGARAGAARKVMRRLGAHLFLAEIPAANTADAPARAA